MEHPYILGYLFVCGLTKILDPWIGCRRPSEIGSDRTLCGSLCWGWPNGKRIGSNQEHLMNTKYKFYILLSPLFLNSEVKVLRLGLPGFRSERRVLMPVLESDTKS